MPDRSEWIEYDGKTDENPFGIAPGYPFVVHWEQNGLSIKYTLYIEPYRPIIIDMDKLFWQAGGVASWVGKTHEEVRNRLHEFVLAHMAHERKEWKREQAAQAGNLQRSDFHPDRQDRRRGLARWR